MKQVNCATLQAQRCNLLGPQTHTFPTPSSQPCLPTCFPSAQFPFESAKFVFTSPRNRTYDPAATTPRPGKLLNAINSTCGWHFFRQTIGWGKKSRIDSLKKLRNRHVRHEDLLLYRWYCCAFVFILFKIYTVVIILWQWIFPRNSIYEILFNLRCNIF